MIKIAIADDHKVFLDSLGILLGTQKDFEVVIQATNGQELINRISPAIMPDIILLDLEMDGLDGLETITILREKYEDAIKIIVLSMHQEERIIEEVIERGAHGYVSKTVEASEVINIIRKVQETGFYLELSTTRNLLKRLYSKNNNGESLEDPQLNEKEIQILQFICQEMSTKQIAGKTGLSVNTVNSYRKLLISKTNSKNVVGLVLYALEKGYFVR